MAPGQLWGFKLQFFWEVQSDFICFVQKQVGTNICFFLRRFAFFGDDSGGRELNDEYGLYDGMTPKCAIGTQEGMTVAMFFTKPPTRGVNNQEIHLLKMRTVPLELAQVYRGR